MYEYIYNIIICVIHYYDLFLKKNIQVLINHLSDRKINN